MSQTKALLPHLRHQLIKEHIATKTQDDVAKLCGCERRTIVRDIAAMKQSGEWWEWLEYELHRLQRDGEVSDETKYREIARLYGKQFIKEHVAADVTGDIVLRWDTDDDADADDTVPST